MEEDLKNPLFNLRFVSLKKVHEVQYWTHALGVSAAELRRGRRSGRVLSARRAGVPRFAPQVLPHARNRSAIRPLVNNSTVALRY